jgi:hypothetical protein
LVLVLVLVLRRLSITFTFHRGRYILYWICRVCKVPTVFLM